MIIERVLDRRTPTDFTHVEKYPGNTLRMLQRTVAKVEKTLTFPSRYTPIYDQGQEGACVGFGESIMMSILNRKLYDALWLYREAQIIDEYTDTPPAGGTSLRAGFDILRDKGHRQLWGGQSKPPKLDEGIVDVNRWLTTVDEVRTAISEGKPVCLGINWYTAFYDAARKKTEAWVVDKDAAWGSLAGGHCICVTGASDKRQAVQVTNSWGLTWGVRGKAWLSYDALRRLLGEAGEAAIITDR